jgi:hypothetical protein
MSAIHPLELPWAAVSCWAIQSLMICTAPVLDAFDGITDVDAVALIVMDTSVTHDAPLFPQALTCTV